MLKRIKQSVDYVNSKTLSQPRIGLILGSGLGNFCRSIQVECELPYESIPHFPQSGIEGHQGALVFGTHRGIPLVVMQGRVHFYEGYSMEDITYPIRVLKHLGIEALLVTNAAGGMNPAFRVGDLMLITDHINMMPNPLIGPNHEALGPRFPDMSKAYDPGLLASCKGIARELAVEVQQGIYVAVSGPTYETPAEYHFFRVIGGDAVGMSTVPEVIIARHMNLRCFAMSVITDLGIPGQLEPITHQMVQEAAAKAEPRMTDLLLQLIERNFRHSA